MDYKYILLRNLYFFSTMILYIHKINRNKFTLRNQRHTFEVASVMAMWKEFNPFAEKANKNNRYWLLQSVGDIVEEADKLFEEEKYMDVYEILNRLKFHRNVEVQWRICRALFKMSCEPELSKSVKREMVQEAYDIMKETLPLGEDDANVHKWMAIILDAKCGLDGTIQRVKVSGEVKKHLMIAIELNPEDVILLYMMGKWCFEMSRLSLFQKVVAAVLFGTPPESSYFEAYEYFLKAEDIKPRFYVPNLYMLGRTCYHMKQYYRARFYLNIAANLPSRTQREKTDSENARLLAKHLEKYDLTNEALLFEYPFDETFKRSCSEI